MLNRFIPALAAAAILSLVLPGQSAMAQAAKTETVAIATAAAQDAPAEMRAWQARVEADAEAKKKADTARKQAAARRAAKKAEQEAAAKAEAERIAAETEKLRKRYWWLPKSAIEAKVAEQEQQRAGAKKQVAAKPEARQAQKPAEKPKQAAKSEAEKPVQVAAERKPVPFMFGLFDAPKPEPAVLNEEQAVHDATLASVPEKKRFQPKEQFVPTTVPFKGYKPGTIVIDTKSKHLYFVESPVSARRYGVAVGKEGLLFTGKATVGAKQPWPRWIPTKEMIARDPSKYGRYADGMDGGPKNPLGARAIYLYQGKQDTYLRIHGTNAPETIGTASSNGCFRMINEHVIDLYDRVQMGAEVIVL